MANANNWLAVVVFAATVVAAVASATGAKWIAALDVASAPVPTSVSAAFVCPHRRLCCRRCDGWRWQVGSVPRTTAMKSRHCRSVVAPSSSWSSSSSSSSSSYSTSSKLPLKGDTSQSRSRGRWFPVRPSDALPSMPVAIAVDDKNDASDNGTNDNGDAAPTAVVLTSGYDAVVRAAHVRHVLLETEEIADLALDTYMRGNRVAAHGAGAKAASAADAAAAADGGGDGDGADSSASLGALVHDPFGALARDLSACVQTRNKAGRVGWIDNPLRPDLRSYTRANVDADADVNEKHSAPFLSSSSSSSSSSFSSSSLPQILPADIVKRLFELRPKGGDVLKLRSSITDMWHLIRVDDLLVDYVPDTYASAASMRHDSANVDLDNHDEDDKKQQHLNNKGGTNRIIYPRAKLKGSGITPRAPRIDSTTATTTTTKSAAWNDKGDDDRNRVDQNQRQHQSIKQKEETIAHESDEPIAVTYHIQTSGCQMNVADSERLEGILRHSLNLRPSSDPLTADVVVLNTCTIRDHAEQKVYDALGPHAARKRRGEAVSIVVSGCVAQQEGERLLRTVPEVDVVMGPQYVGRLADLLDGVGRGRQIVATDPTLLTEGGVGVGVGAGKIGGNVNDEGTSGVGFKGSGDGGWAQPVRGHSVRAWVNVIHGCNEHCTYCVVPAVRGVEQSRSMEAILDECLRLNDKRKNHYYYAAAAAAAAGKDDNDDDEKTKKARQGGTYKEVTLLGQNIDAYGRDMLPRRTFASLLHYLNDNIPPNTIERIRYVTSHPRYFSDRVIDAVASLDKVCECFHMPFQSGDDAILRAMGRGYTSDSYLKIIDKIRRASTDASICADVIVGFPGESDRAFQHTLDLMEYVKFDNINTFAYSPRPNTEAASWTNQIPDEIKMQRLRAVQDLATKHGQIRSDRYVGRTDVEVLVEDCNPKNLNQVMGRTRQGRQVFFDGNIDDLMGTLVHVTIDEARPWSLMGHLTLK